jgi:hypothetical protein
VFTLQDPDYALDQGVILAALMIKRLDDVEALHQG